MCPIHEKLFLDKRPLKQTFILGYLINLYIDIFTIIQPLGDWKCRLAFFYGNLEFIMLLFFKYLSILRIKILLQMLQRYVSSTYFIHLIVEQSSRFN